MNEGVQIARWIFNELRMTQRTVNGGEIFKDNGIHAGGREGGNDEGGVFIGVPYAIHWCRHHPRERATAL